MATVRAYNPDKVIAVIVGVPVSSLKGYADGSFIEYTQVSDDFADEAGTDGDVTRSILLDRRITIKVKLMQSSAANAALSAVLAADRASPNGVAVGPTSITDLSGSSLLLCPKSWIVRAPDADYDKTAKVREWTIRGVMLDSAAGRLDGGNAAI